MLSLYTSRNGWFLRKEDDLGSLEPGKLGDVVVLNKDYFSVPDLRAEADPLGAHRRRRRDRPQRRLDPRLTPAVGPALPLGAGPRPLSAAVQLRWTDYGATR